MLSTLPFTWSSELQKRTEELNLILTSCNHQSRVAKEASWLTHCCEILELLHSPAVNTVS
jgi:hypothetical protein